VNSSDFGECSNCHAAKAIISHRGKALCQKCYEANVPPWSRATPDDAQSSRWKAYWWPKIDGLATAEHAMKHGYVAALLLAGMTVVAVVLMPGSFPRSALIDAGLFCAIAWGLRRASRVAACAGLGLYLFERWHVWSTTGKVGMVPLFLIFTLGFVHAIRGAFAVHKYRANAGTEGSPSAA
jgi:hypothetical protein